MKVIQGCFAQNGLGPADAQRLAGAGPPWMAPQIWADRYAGMGLCRHNLAPAQPAISPFFADPAGRVTLVLGQVFPARQDAGPRLNACLTRDGPDGLAALDGDYACVHWDPAERRLTLAISAAATQILYWHARDGRLWFATTLAQLFRFPDVPRQPAALQIAAHLCAFILDPSDTLFDGVKLLTPGTALVMDGKGVREIAFWRPDPAARLKLRRDTDYVEAARELLTNAVSNRLGQRNATTITGGLDSSTVSATAARLVDPAMLDTYTNVPPPGRILYPDRGWYADERGPVGAIAAMHPNMRTHFCHSTAPAGFEHDPTGIFVMTGRSLGTSNMAGWMGSAYKAARDAGYSTLIMGSSGNFTLSYDGQRGFADIARDGRPDLALKRLVQISRYRGRSLTLEVKAFAGQLLPGLRQIWRDWRGPHWLSRIPIRPDYVRKIGLVEHLAAWGAHGAWPAQEDGRAIQAYYLHNRRARTLEGNIGISTLFGIRLSDPLADRALTEFCLAIPREQYVLGGRDRALARRVSAGLLPESVLNEKLWGKHNIEWFDRICPQRAEFAAELETLERVPLAAEMLDLPRLKALVDNWPADGAAANVNRLDYEYFLTRAIHMGRFIRWLDGGNQGAEG